jgi:hypothetical protein
MFSHNIAQPQPSHPQPHVRAVVARPHRTYSAHTQSTMSDTPITSTEGQAMVNAVVASIRAEHAGFPAYRFKKTVGSKHFYEAPSSKACLLSKDGPHSKKKVSYFTVSIGDRIVNHDTFAAVAAVVFGVQVLQFARHVFTAKHACQPVVDVLGDLRAALWAASRLRGQ